MMRRQRLLERARLPDRPLDAPTPGWANLASDAIVRRMQVDILEAKNQLSKLVRAAAAGQEVVIARNGRPMARLVPMGRGGRLGGWGVLEIPAARIDAGFSRKVDAGIARAFAGER